MRVLVLICYMCGCVATVSSFVFALFACLLFLSVCVFLSLPSLCDAVALWYVCFFLFFFAELFGCGIGHMCWLGRR